MGAANKVSGNKISGKEVLKKKKSEEKKILNNAFSLVRGLFSRTFLYKIILEPEKSPRK